MMLEGAHLMGLLHLHYIAFEVQCVVILLSGWRGAAKSIAAISF